MMRKEVAENQKMFVNQLVTLPIKQENSVEQNELKDKGTI